MLFNDLINSCIHEKVAAAALMSIGGGFARRFRVIALKQGLEAEILAARIVRDFRHNASAYDIERVQSVMNGCDLPLLMGFRIIIELALMTEVREDHDFYFGSFAASHNQSLLNNATHV